MRPGLDAPTEGVPAETVGRMCEYLDRQSPIALAVWVRHEQTGPDGPIYDHHSMLGVDDARYACGDMRAFEEGISRECSFPGWLDVFPRSEVEELRAFGDVLWVRKGEPDDGLDPLDFRTTWEPFEVPAATGEAFAGLTSQVPGVRRVEASILRLWKGERELHESVQFFVDFAERRPYDFAQVENALREAGILPTNRGMVAGVPANERVRAAVIYAR